MDNNMLLLKTTNVCFCAEDGWIFLCTGQVYDFIISESQITAKKDKLQFIQSFSVCITLYNQHVLRNNRLKLKTLKTT